MARTDDEEAAIRALFLIILIAMIPMHGHTCSIEEHILVHYDHVVGRLNQHGCKGPFAREIAKFALIRQIVEDGPTRNNSKSIVGMSIGQANTEALEELGLTVGRVNSDGIRLKKCTDENGQSMYAIHGPRANTWSAAALSILWDKYINQVHKDRFTAEEIEGWNVCKDLSAKIASGEIGQQQRYHEWLCLAKRALRKANALYSSTAASLIAKTVLEMESLFEFVDSRGTN
jgi:hypothetical protein